MEVDSLISSFLGLALEEPDLASIEDLVKRLEDLGESPRDSRVGYFLEIPYIWEDSSTRSYILQGDSIVYTMTGKSLLYSDVPSCRKRTYVYDFSSLSREMQKQVSRYFRVANPATIRPLPEYGNRLRYLGYPVKFIPQEVDSTKTLLDFFGVSAGVREDRPPHIKYLTREILEEPMGVDYESLSFDGLMEAYISFIYYSEVISRTNEELRNLSTKAKERIRNDTINSIDQVIRSNMETIYKKYILGRMGWYSDDAKAHFGDEYERELHTMLGMGPQTDEYITQILNEELEKGAGYTRSQKGKRRKEIKEQLDLEFEIEHEGDIRQFLLSSVRTYLTMLRGDIYFYGEEHICEEDEEAILREEEGNCGWDSGGDTTAIEEWREWAQEEGGFQEMLSEDEEESVSLSEEEEDFAGCIELQTKHTEFNEDNINQIDFFRGGRQIASFNPFTVQVTIRKLTGTSETLRIKTDIDEILLGSCDVTINYSPNEDEEKELHFPSVNMLALPVKKDDP